MRFNVVIRHLGAGTLVALLVGCAFRAPSPVGEAGVQFAWVQLGGTNQVRAVIPTNVACPVLTVDGRSQPMAVRVAAGTAPQRPSAATPPIASVFDMQVCETTLPNDATDIRIAGRPLPAVRPQAKRIVVLGDTGCRIAGRNAQPCNDPQRWPFAQVASLAAAMNPDMVVHVGDYHYRESPCPEGFAGCAGSPWGYGWDAWRADFFAPAAPLLAAAPWVFARGNHEECARGGQGWFRLLAPEPYSAARSCDDPAQDGVADFTEPYAVSLGPDSRMIVFDSSAAGNLPLKAGDAKDERTRATYARQARTMDALVGPHTWFLSHHPVLGFAPDPRRPDAPPFRGNPALLEALRDAHGANYYPADVQLALHGHVHLFQAIDFASRQAATLVAGHGGDAVDQELPSTTANMQSPARDVQVDHMAHSNSFGFLLMERDAGHAADWNVTAFRLDGSVLTRCRLSADKSLVCEAQGLLR